MVTVELLFWIHLLSLALGGVAVFGIPVVGSKLMAAPVDSRPVLFRIMHQMSVAGRAALVLLLITGPLLLWLGFGGVAPNMTAFWIKMVLVVLIIAIIAYGGINARRAQSGDTAASRRAPLIGIAGMVTYVLLILAAAFAFD
jgi:hypothetical protein